MYHAVPKLKTFCHERGYEFQVVDMRWGVSDGAANDHITLQLCLNEIKKCQNISTGPNFVSLLSHKYGYRPLPPTIGSDDFELMFSSVIDEEERALMTRWYKEDNNAVPSAYTLLSISSIIANFGHPSNRILAEKAKAEWWRAYEKLSDVITKASLSCIKDSITAHKYISSLTEKEVESGVVGVDNAPSCCLWLKREITGLSANDRNSTARAFIDQLDDKGTPNQTSQDLLQLLKNDRIPSALPQSNISDYSVPWKRGKIDPAVHSKSITNLCKTFQSRLEGMIERGIAEREQVHDALYEEVIQHASFCQQKCEAFHGRQDTLKRIESYVKSDSRQPMVIYGQSGCGKTSIVAMAATMVNKWLQGRCKLVLRFLGTTPDSTIIHLLLTTVCEQIVKSYNSNMVVPRGLKELREFLPQCLTLASAESQLVVFLDSLDQLDSQDAARQLSWLPRQLPSYVKIVVSTLPEEEHTCFPMLQGMIKEESLFVPVPQLAQDDAHDILQEWFKSAKRTLTTQQMDILTRGFEKCPLPLYLKLCFDEACRWRSFTPQDETNLEDTVRGVINCLFARIEREMGKVLVQRALGYLTAAKSGLSESEIEDILSCDDDVLNDVYQYWTPPTRRLPPLLWIRIHSALSSYLVERGADGSRVIYWYHRQFIEAARERYLSDERQKKLIHRGEADYFSGKWANGVKKSYVTRQGQKSEADRFVASQPLAFTSTKYNLRKLNELPTHLIGSGNLKALKKDVLCNFDWLLTKVKATSFRQVMDDFRTATKSFPDDEDITRVKETLQLSEEGIILSPYQLPGQLLGRMPNEACNLLDMAAVGDVTAGLLPSHLCLTKPGGPLIHTMTGHTDKVSAMRITRNGQYVITVAVQCTLPEDLTFKSFIEDGSTLVTERDGLWSLWSSKSGEMLRQWKMPHILSDGMIVDATIDRRVLVLSSEKVKKSLGLVDVDQGKMVASFTFDKRIRKCALMNDGRVIAVIVDYELVTLRLVGNDIPPVAEFEESADSKRPVTA
ncbi:NACHT domain- and WD repeat-containing protein 1-like isoform X2 [Ptychodera flava]|uniref:NACHT domain- and WD repeat-containing protein 1-like isoform X2 n=1 Tax=Ptychodera flava TaxID=63121 RepID=UPI003969E346